MSATEKTAEALAGRLFEQCLGMFDVMSVYLGDRLGLYRSLHEDGPAAAAELASRAGIDARYAREWLEQQAVTGFLEVDDASADADGRRYSLPDAFVDTLLNPESGYSMAPMARSIVACAKVLPQLLDAYRSGGGVEWAAYGTDMIEAQGDFNRPWLVNTLGTDLLPAMPAVHDRLMADPPAHVADVACGVGWASISIARAYPSVIVDGFDLDPASIALARANAERAGVSDRVHFQQADGADLSARGQYDLAVIVESVHDLANPVEVLSTVRGMLKPDGLALVADEKTEDAFVAPGSELERTFYGYSLFTCLPAVMTERPTAATGTVMRESTMRRFAADAGFNGFERREPAELEMLRFYLLSAG